MDTNWKGSIILHIEKQQKISINVNDNLFAV